MKRPSATEIIPESDALEGAPHPRFAPRLIGHQRAELDLLNGYRTGRLPQAWIMGGRLGIGKATLAWRLARFVLAYPDISAPEVQGAQDLSVPADHPVSKRINSLSHGDLAVLRRAYNDKTKRHFTEIRVDDVRKALEKFHHAAGEGGWRVAIIDCADELNKSSANALLKMIEEPPPRSLFLMISHQPAQVLPTIRSRSRMLMLPVLSAAEVLETIKGLVDPHDHDHAALAMAAERSGGSVREAMRLLDGKALEVTSRIESILKRLPNVDWKSVYLLSDVVCARDANDDFGSTITAIYDWLDAEIRSRAGEGAARLAPLAEVWEKVAGSVRNAEALNLDKRALLLSIFSDLSAASAAAQR